MRRMDDEKWRESLRRLKEEKRRIKKMKYGDYTQYTPAQMVGYLIEEFSELMIALRKGTTEEILEGIADLSNVCDFLYYLILNEEGEKGEKPYCFGDPEFFDSVRCRSTICEWREECRKEVEKKGWRVE